MQNADLSSPEVRKAGWEAVGNIQPAVKLTEFLRKKKKESEAAERSVDWEGRKQRWTDAVRSLYRQIEKWLVRSIDERTVLIEKKDVALEEEHIGRYSVQSMFLKIGADIVELKPVGALIVGCRGRVDIILRNRSVSFVIAEDGEWKIIVRQPTVKYHPLDEEAFGDVIMQLMQ